jgi:hypothetical protein
MSTSDLYILNRKSTTHCAEFRNGWGSGPCIWDHLASKYFPDVNFSDYDRKDYVGHDRKNRMVWDLASDKRVTGEERAVLMISFDKAYVPKSHLKEAGEACVAAHGMIEAHGFWNGVNHWKAIGEALIGLSKRKLHWQARGVVLNCTSVQDMWIQPSRDYLANAWPIFEENPTPAPRSDAPAPGYSEDTGKEGK